jgi:hypothetical protein
MDLFLITDVLYELLWIPFLKMNSDLYLTLVVWFRGSVYVDISYVGETEAGWIAWMLGGPVPTTELHRCADGGEIEGWRTPSNEPTHHERRTILAAYRHRSNTDASRLLRFAIPGLWSWNVSYEFLKYLLVHNFRIYTHSCRNIRSFATSCFRIF